MSEQLAADTDVVTPAAGSVKSVDRALNILEALSTSGGSLGVTEIAAATALPQGTVHRILQSLQQRGYVRHETGRKYALGTAILRLSDAAHGSIGGRAQPYLSQMVEVTAETANLAVLEGDHVVYISQVPSPHMLRMFAEVGRRVLPHSTAVGKILLADRSAEYVTSLLRRTGMPRRNERTITTVDGFLRELVRVRENGYAVDDGEEDLSVRCLAVPVLDGTRAVAAMSVSGPAERFTGVRDPDLAWRLRSIAAEFASRLGH